MDSDGDGKTTKKGNGKSKAKGKGRPKGRAVTKKPSQHKTSKLSESEHDQSQEEISEERDGSLDIKSTSYLEDDSILDEPNISLSFNVGLTKVPLHSGKPLTWNHKVNLIGEKCPNPHIHLCDTCQMPILQYGRMIPCKHVFCHGCAVKDAILCKKCGDPVVRVEKAILGSVYKCHFENCARTYLSSRDLQAHIQHRHMRKTGGGLLSGGYVNPQQTALGSRHTSTAQNLSSNTARNREQAASAAQGQFSGQSSTFPWQGSSSALQSTPTGASNVWPPGSSSRSTQQNFSKSGFYS
jgi:hypothetical protein